MTEILTLVQTQKLMKRMVVILYGTTFWKEVINFDALVRHGMIAADDLNLFEFADDVDTAFQKSGSRIDQVLSAGRTGSARHRQVAGVSADALPPAHVSRSDRVGRAGLPAVAVVQLVAGRLG